VARCQRSATFLPEVARHEQWSHVETIDALIAKAGYVGTISPELRISLAVTRYQSSAATLTYDEYCALAQPSASQVHQAGGVAITVPA
jgi:AMMECR1 domain-containing protein